AGAALKEATVRTGVWRQAQEEVAQQERDEAALLQQHQQWEKQRSRLERIRRTAPTLRSMREQEAELAALGDVIELPEDAAATLADARRELAMAQHTLQERQNEKAGLAAALKEITLEDN